MKDLQINGNFIKDNIRCDKKNIGNILNDVLQKVLTDQLDNNEISIKQYLLQNINTKL
ncbi:MAG: hypothetical protein Homavirus34_5 [Homavirus sp.]|uniref:Uncharacterized protein n=1 Tax=Homavirus sp. TaxID=2487769 RepID=A0A3G5AAG0_9VIRU|nr:MAG: hypothetical protein Homavirus34_5 [Homavirus sp.]